MDGWWIGLRRILHFLQTATHPEDLFGLKPLERRRTVEPCDGVGFKGEGLWVDGQKQWEDHGKSWESMRHNEKSSEIMGNHGKSWLYALKWLEIVGLSWKIMEKRT